MIKRSILFASLIALYNLALAQDSLSTRSETHIFWQPGERLMPGDFQGTIDYNSKKHAYCDSLKMCTIASVGVFGILDVPKNKRKRGKLFEKVYFAPAFQIDESVFYPHDSIGLVKQQVVFDIYELSARSARKQLKSIVDSIGKSYGTRLTFFKTIEENTRLARDGLVQAYTLDVYVNNEEGALEKWQKMVEQGLKDFEEFATTPEDCYRFVKNEPIKKGYIKAKSVIGVLGR